jgi:RNA polymerase sigma-70 factor (ECF subfamily)
MTPDQERALTALMLRTQQGDVEACERLLAELRLVIGQFVNRRVGRVPWGDDAVQEALLSVYRGRHTWNPARPFAPWFYAVAQSRLIDVIRRERRLAGREVADPAALDLARTRSVEAAISAASELRAAVATLPDAHRRVIELLKLEERSIDDVARVLSTSAGNVRVMAHRAMRGLRRMLEGT